jgi:hypothetical protein
VPLRGNDDFEHDLLAAKERDLKPLIEESAESLELDYGQAGEMETFLTEAWLTGTRTGHAQIRARADQRKADVGPVGVKEVEADFKALMEESADALNLSLPRTIAMWGFLGEAWIAGTRSCEAELMAMFIELRSDVAEEALQWLAEENRGGQG